MNAPRTRRTWLVTGTVALAVIALLTSQMAASLAAPTGGQEAPPVGFAAGAEVTVATDRLNVRTGPGLGYPVVRTLSRGDAFFTGSERVPADGFTWSTMNVPDGSAIGWVADQYLSTGASGGGSDGGAFAVGMRVTVTTRLNFRTGPGTDNAVIRGLAPGAVLTLSDGPVTASGYTWYQGRTTEATGGDTGWVIQDGLVAAAAELPDPTLAYDVGAIVHVDTDTLRLRAGAGTSAAIVARLAGGTTLTVTGGPVGAEGYTWYPVTTAAGASGWVACDFIAWGVGGGTIGGTGGGYGAGASVVVDADRLNLRSAPGTEAAVIGILTAGTPLTVAGGPEPASGYAWYRVETGDGMTGWVIGEALAAR